MMRIEVVGAGAIGLLFAARLAGAGVDVKVWTRTQRQSELIRKQGISLLNEAGEAVLHADSDWLHPDRVMAHRQEERTWIVLAVKQQAIDAELIDSLRALTASNVGESSILCLQNGIGHLDKLAAELPWVPLYAAVTTEGAKREDERSVRHIGTGMLWISEKAQNLVATGEKSDKAQKMLLKSLRKAGFEASLSNEMENRIFQKLLVNAVINPLTAIFDVANGELPNDKNRLSLMEALHSETYGILTEAGMKDHADSWNNVLEVCRRTAANVSSMLADVRAGHPTEIDAINGAVSKLAAKQGMASPLNDAMTAIITTYSRSK
ncbi:ketopantoate reductase family protein [Paenibacillus soyae]|uniref:2-dehydropantoate 2-reductase n=1 Tax=Paenibacillus soyae TaxID=2969249 RepID=A0A9X2MTY4_9BACL|nr:2-dehydropantoate 2-reductase [Paenibacillus soyae]MCR2803712.1 2-dehydropantoate 2-reductase [Paenibacillus soyae]